MASRMQEQWFFSKSGGRAAVFGRVPKKFDILNGRLPLPDSDTPKSLWVGVFNVLQFSTSNLPPQVCMVEAPIPNHDPSSMIYRVPQFRFARDWVLMRLNWISNRPGPNCAMTHVMFLSAQDEEEWALTLSSYGRLYTLVICSSQLWA